MRRVILTALLAVGCSLSALADGTKDDPEVLYKYQVGAEFQIKLAKGLELELSPELRYNDGYDKMHLNGGVSYKTLGCLYLGASYRLILDRVESSSYSYSVWGTSSYETESSHRYAFDVTYKDKMGDFTPSFRAQYTTYGEDGESGDHYFRYKAKVDYNIPKCKFTPFISVEAFQELDDNMFDRMRYSTGFSYKLSKSKSLSFDYKFDYYLLEYKNANVFSIGYKVKF